MAAVQFRPAERKYLETYIEAEGHFSPPELGYFEYGGELEGACSLCYPKEYTSHNEFRMVKFPNGRRLFICEECSTAIDETENITVAVEYNREFVKERYKNCFYYRTKGIIPTRVLQLSRNWDSYTCGLCFTRENKIPEFSIRLPVNSFGEIGHHIPICQHCADEIDHSEVYDYVDTCFRCTNKYPITADEYESRKGLSDSLGDHLCGACFTAHHGYKGRFMFFDCVKCHQSKVLDLSLYTTVPPKDELICNSCLESSKTNPLEFLQTSTSTKYAIYPYDGILSLVILIFEEELDVWKFIYIEQIGGRFNLLHASVESYSTPELCSWKSIAYVREHFPITVKLP